MLESVKHGDGSANGRENGNCYSNMRVALGLYGGTGKENGNYYIAY